MAAIDDLDAAHDAVVAAVDDGASNDGTAAEAALRVAAVATEAADFFMPCHPCFAAGLNGLADAFAAGTPAAALQWETKEK